MKLEFTTLIEQKPGLIASLLKQSYLELIKSDPITWGPEQANWEQYDREVFEHPESVGKCIFLTWLNDCIVGFGSWDPRQKPQLGIIGHNCVLPEFRGQGIGKCQINEILRRFQLLGIQTATVSTNEHPFFVPAQRMYAACGFREINRIPWKRDSRQNIIVYEKKLRDE